MAFCGSMALAQTTVDTIESVSHLRNEQKYLIRLGSINYQYQEPGLIKLQGRLNEIDFSYRRIVGYTRVPLWVAGELGYAFGGTTYDGAIVNLQTGVKTPSTESSRESILTLQGQFGVSVVDSSIQSLDTYAGLGIWSLTNKIDGRASYTRNINYIYLPVGTQYNLKLGPSFTFVTGVQFNLLLIGTVKSSLSDINSSNSDINNTQSSGRGYKLKVGGEWNMPSWTAFLETYYQTWNIEDSDKTSVVSGTKILQFYEPKNETTMLGLTVGGRF